MISRVRLLFGVVSAAMLLGLLVPPAVASSGSVTTNLVSGGTLLADGSVLADTSTVTIGTSALLTPGVDTRTIMTIIDTTTVYETGSAVGPEGWTVEFSTDGSTWSTTEPAAATVRKVRATKGEVAAGAVSGSSQVYSSQTTSNIPATSFTGSSGGDGWDVFFSEENVYNIFHHGGSIVIDCHIITNAQRCAGWTSTATFANYLTGMDSSGYYDSLSGHIYVMTVSTSGTAQAGVLCVDVSGAGMPESCGFKSLSSSTPSTSWNELGVSTTLGRKLFGSFPSIRQVLCYDAATNASCPGFPLTDTDFVTGAEGSLVRMIADGTRIWIKSPNKIRCFTKSLATCSGWSSSGKTITSNSDLPIAVHQNEDGDTDGVCFYNTASKADESCLNLAGSFEATWQSPFNYSGSQKQRGDPFDGASTLGRYYWTGVYNQEITCYDFKTNTACAAPWTNFTAAKAGASFGWGVYTVRRDPTNPFCLWMNSDGGTIRTFDAITGNAGCTQHPAITLQPSQFAPRYACSTTSGIREWTRLSLDSITGGTADTVTLTVRDASGVVVPGWRNKPVVLGQSLDMTGLDVALSGSRPTFSFQFSGITNTPTSAVISLDYLGAGPELCVDTKINTANLATPASGCPSAWYHSELIDGVDTLVNIRSLSVSNRSSCVASFVEQSTPSAPTSLAASGSNTTAELRYSPPTSNGGLAISQYVVSTDGGQTWSDANPQENGDGSFTTTLTGLTAGQTYQMQVAAVNSKGRGTAASVSVTVQLASISTLADVPLNTGTIYFTETSTNNTRVTYTTDSTTVCAMTGNTTLSLIAVGTCTVTSYAAGNSSTVPVILPVTTTTSFQVLPNPATVPGAPSSLSLTPGDAQITATWTAPTDGGAGITDYVIQYQFGANWVPFNDGVSSSIGTVVVGLTNNRSYPIRVAAVNSVGQGPWSATSSATPAALSAPNPITNLNSSRTDSSTTFTVLTFTAPSSNGGSAITDYKVEHKSQAGVSWTAFNQVSTATTETVTGLTIGELYDFRVAAVNIVGTAEWVSTSLLSAAVADRSLQLSWSSPLSGGAQLDHYSIEYRVSGTSSWLQGETTTSNSETLTGLTNGTTYDVRVAALTTSATSSYTSVVSATPNSLTAPETPTAVVLTAGDGQISVSWTAPADNGLSISDYTIKYRAQGAGSWTTLNDGVSTNTRAVIRSLTNGTTYEVTIAAINSAGTGPSSTPATSKPATTPSAPTSVTSFGGTNRVTLRWSAPISDGGSPVLGYKVQYKLLSAAQWIDAREVNGTLASISGLLTGSNYSVRVAARNAIGLGAYATGSSAADNSCVSAVGFSMNIEDINRCHRTSIAGGLDVGGNVLGVEVTAPSNAAANPVLLQVTDLTPEANLLKGLPHFRVQATESATGNAVTTFQRPLTIVLMGSPLAVPMVSTDSGTTWEALPERTFDEVLALGPSGHGYQAANGTFTVYTMHLTDWALQGTGSTAPPASRSDSTPTSAATTSTGPAILPIGSATITGPDSSSRITCVAPDWTMDPESVAFTWQGIDAASSTLTSAPWQTVAQLPDAFRGKVECGVLATAHHSTASLMAEASPDLTPKAAPVVPRSTTVKPLRLTFKQGVLSVSTTQTAKLKALLQTSPTRLNVTIERGNGSQAARKLAASRWLSVKKALRSAGFNGPLRAKFSTGGSGITLSTG